MAKNRIKIICVAATRPNFMKIAPLLEEFKNLKKNILETKKLQKKL